MCGKNYVSSNSFCALTNVFSDLVPRGGKLHKHISLQLESSREETSEGEVHPTTNETVEHRAIQTALRRNVHPTET